MSMRDSIKKQKIEEMETMDENNNKVISQIKIIQRNYPCRPQVLERRQKWVKFGEKAAGIERGKNQKGILTITGPEKFKSDEGE